jgi:hypothetical protein
MHSVDFLGVRNAKIEIIRKITSLPSWRSWLDHRYQTQTCYPCIDTDEPCLVGLVILTNLKSEFEYSEDNNANFKEKASK